LLTLYEPNKLLVMF